MAEAAVNPETLWTRLGSRNNTLLIPFPCTADGIEYTHQLFTHWNLAARREMWKAARPRDELAIVVTEQAIRRIAPLARINIAVAAKRARSPTR